MTHGRSTRSHTTLLALSLLLGAVACAQPPVDADVLLVGRFVTLDPAQPEVEALAVRDERIVALGSVDVVASQVDPETPRVELSGVALPGFAEGHGHVEAVGALLEVIDLQRLSRQEILDRVAAEASSVAPGEWIRGRGWDQGFWEDASFPTATELDAVAPDNPVILTRIDGHSVWLNARALTLAGIDAATPDPPGGRIVRDAAGAPSGVLVDAAVGLAVDVVPEPTHQDRVARVRAALQQYQRWGVTSIHDAGVDLEGIEIYDELLAAGELPLRVYVMASGRGQTAESVLATGPRIADGGRLTVRSFKVLLDGALGSRGAQLEAPYADAPDETGLVLMEDGALAELLARATDGGFQVAAHAIGDLAVRRALDVFAAGGPQVRTLRPRIEHVSVVAPEDVERFAELGVIASMQPVFVGEYSRWALDRLGEERVDWVYPTRRLLEAGALVAAGTDYPASDSGDPIHTLYGMVSRKGADGLPEGGFLPGEAVTVEQALTAMTSGAAYAAFQEEDLGVLAVGKLADLTVLSDDPRAVAVESLRELRVTATVVGGNVELRADRAESER